MKNPTISVIMPVFNNENYVETAIKSILTQSFDDFEFIIVDDNSTDNTKLILDQVQDKRIMRLNNVKHIGNYRCRNQGIDIAKGQYICVMDSDDLSTPNRLSEQFNFMEANLNYLAAGSDIEFLQRNCDTILFQRLDNPETLKVALLKDNICTHPTLIIRSEVFKKHGIRYNEEYYYSGDYDLLVNISRIGAISNIPKPLLKYRIHKKQISVSKNKEQVSYANQIRLKQLSYLMMEPSINEILLHLSLMNELFIPDNKHNAAYEWCNKLIKKNANKSFYSQEHLHTFLKNCLYICMKKALC